MHAEGEKEPLNNFVADGALRLYLLDDQLKEHNMMFAFENWWIGDIGAFLANEESRYYLQAMENSIIYQISSADQQILLDHHIKFCRLFRKKFERALIRTQKRLIDNISSSAHSRYQDFLDTYPNYVNRLPDRYIASYIGVTPEFFSKIKKQVLHDYLKQG